MRLFAAIGSNISGAASARLTPYNNPQTELRRRRHAATLRPTQGWIIRVARRAGAVEGLGVRLDQRDAGPHARREVGVADEVMAEHDRVRGARDDRLLGFGDRVTHAAEERALELAARHGNDIALLQA